MKKIVLILFAACWFAGFSAASASAQMGRCGMGGPMGMGGGGGMGMWDGAHASHIISALDLNDSQSTEVKALLQKLQKEMIQKRADIQVAEIELREILDKESVDINVAGAKVKQIASLKTDAAMMHIQGIEDLKSKLTPDQKKKLSEMMQMRGMGHGNAMVDCPKMKGKKYMGPDPGAADAKPAKSKTPKAAPPAHQHNQ